MEHICVKLKQRGQEKYRKMLSVEENIFPEFDPDSVSTLSYAPGATIQDDDWFCIQNVKSQDYSIDLFSEAYTTSDFQKLSRIDFERIEYLFILGDRFISFQNITKSNLLSKKRIFSMGDDFKYETNCSDVVIKDLPDAIYDKNSDSLYFRRLESITSIFKGIDLLYREATQRETDCFLANDFICLKDNYSGDKVKTANRKRIALAIKTLEGLSETDKANIFNYIGEYCSELKVTDNSFEVGSENELKMLLYGIEQRFYTTQVGGEKRLANSVIVLNGGQING